jgi:uncharacterized membrane protein YfcA
MARGNVDLLYPASGFLVGVVVGITGVGGGSLMTPLLILVFGFAPATAIGTDLLYAAITKSAGTLAHRRFGNVDWRVVRLLCAGSVPASALTLLALHTFMRDPKAINAVLSATLGFALLATAASVLFRRHIAAYATAVARGGEQHVDAPTYRTALLGAVLGTLVTLSSVGAGALGSVALLVLFPAMPMLRIVGTDIAHAVPLTLVAGLGHAAMGGIDWALLASLLVGSIPGIWLGTLLANRFPERLLHTALAAVLVVVGVRLVL